MKGVYNMKSFTKNLWCSLCVILLSILFNLLITALYTITYFFWGDIELEQYFETFDSETTMQIAIYSVFTVFQVILLILLFKAIGKVIAYRKIDININTVSKTLFILMTIFSAVIVAIFGDGSGWIVISVSNSFFTFASNLLYPIGGKIFYLLLFVVYAIENLVKVGCINKGYKKSISIMNTKNR